jgi:hypothetical protein
MAYTTMLSCWVFRADHTIVVPLTFARNAAISVYRWPRAGPVPGIGGDIGGGVGGSTGSVLVVVSMTSATGPLGASSTVGSTVLVSWPRIGPACWVSFASSAA